MWTAATTDRIYREQPRTDHMRAQRLPALAYPVISQVNCTEVTAILLHGHGKQRGSLQRYGLRFLS